MASRLHGVPIDLSRRAGVVQPRAVCSFVCRRRLPLVPGGMEVPSRAMALGVPAKLRLDAVDPELMIDMGAQSYVERSAWYRKDLRRLD